MTDQAYYFGPTQNNNVNNNNVRSKPLFKPRQITVNH